MGIMELTALAVALGCTLIQRAGKGINADSHVFATMLIKGIARRVSLKAPSYFDADSGASNEVNTYDAARILRSIIPMDGANVCFASLVAPAVAMIRHLEGGIRLSRYIAQGGARNLSLARSFGRMVAFWAIMGMTDRHEGNFLIVPADGDGVGGSLWSIDHENRPEEKACDSYVMGHLASFAACNGVVANMPIANGRAHIAAVYPMSRFVRHAADEMRTIRMSLAAPAGAETCRAIAEMTPCRLNEKWFEDMNRLEGMIRRFA